MTAAVESWDDDDFQGDFQGFGNSAGTAQGSISSRLSIHSESIAADEDWNVVLPSNDEQATTRAVQHAKQAGIPIPQNVPTSALLGGTIKRLGKKPSRQKIDDDWDNDIDMGNAPLVLKPMATKADVQMTEEYDDFEELEGSLGIRFAGKSRDARESSMSAFSPSMGSVTAESEVDDIGGLELPEGPMDFDAILKKRRATEADLSDLSQASPAMEQAATMKTHKKSKLAADDNDDFFNDFDLGGGETLDVQKRTINKNIRLKTKPAATTTRPATTINFHDKPTDKPMHSRSHLPRPVSGSRPSNTRLEPVFESGASHVARDRRPLTTNTSQLLRSKRSLPVLTSQTRVAPQPRPAPFVTGTSNLQPSHASAQRAMPYHLRRDSESNRQGAQSPPMRSHSRLSNSFIPETPSRRGGRDQAPAALAREAASKRNVTKPSRRRNYGDGSELEVFDDLPTSQQKEAKFVKQPIAKGPPKLGLRQAQSARDVREAAKRHALPDRMTTPAPPRTPASPTKAFYEMSQYTPSYLRDTAASRIARESTQSRLAANPRPRSEGPLMPLSTNWKAQVAAKSPQASPSSQKNKLRRVQPQLIRGNGAHVAKTEKGMIYNPNTLRWEGNENTLSRFELPPALETPTPRGTHEGTSYMDRQPLAGSPPRPALIAPMSAATNLQVNGHMVFDPHQMKWLKLKTGRDVSGPLSPSVTDEDEDVFAGLDDLKETSPAVGAGSVAGMASPQSTAATGMGEVHEEFDLGPQFIRLQKEEEMTWRKRCEMWFPQGEARADDGRWRWSIRNIASPVPFA
ncbi:hypothetical protein AMS68_007187 [Peltaster fructicola]|uniref:Cytokinesis regulator n=1 Tax=Peltaster fructicola TaxID=286661 RepID=A0A6H0Y4Y3_9PEZI|nr:hypothetical protein AMS68_007187 [Peltaster fructicola]